MAETNEMNLTSVDEMASEEYFPADQPWVEAGSGVALVGGVCSACGAKSFPRLAVCSSCESDVEPVACELSQEGTLYTFTEVHVGGPGFVRPRVLGYVDLDDGVRVFGQVAAEAADLSIGQRVTTRLGIVRSLPDGGHVTSYQFCAA